MLHQFSHDKKKRASTSPITIISTPTASSASFDLSASFSGLGIEASACTSSSIDQRAMPSTNVAFSLDSYFSRPDSPAVDTSHLQLPSMLPPRYSPSIACYIPSRGKKTGFITFKDGFLKERQNETIHPNHYLDSEHREQFRVTSDNGFFYNATGQLLEGPLLYVLFPNDKLYAGSTTQVLHHSFLSQGIDVKAAGIAYFRCGQLITLSNESGHYKPTFAEMQAALDWFAKGTPNNRFLFEDHSAQNPKEVFNGVRFYDVCLPEMNLIDNTLLLKVVSELKSTADEYYKNHYLSQYTEYSLGSSDDCDDIYYAEEMPTSAPKTNSLALSEPQSILDCPELLYLTCLQRFKEGKTSRFNGQLRLRCTI